MLLSNTLSASQAEAKKQSGFTLIEVLTALAIGAIAVAGITYAMTDRLDENRVNDATAQINELISKGIRCAQANGGSFADCSLNRLLAKGHLNNAVWGDGTGVNPFNGDYTFAAVSGNNNQFTLTMTNVNETEYGALLVDYYDDNAVAATFTGSTFSLTGGSRN